MAKPDWGAIQKQFLADHAITNISPKYWYGAKGINYAPARRYVKNHPLMFLLAVSGCKSMQHVSERTNGKHRQRG